MTDPRHRLAAAVDSVARTRRVLAARLDHGDGWAAEVDRLTADLAAARDWSASLADLLELALRQRQALDSDLTDLVAWARSLPDLHSTRSPEYGKGFAHATSLITGQLDDLREKNR
jgi:hypothetical protein